MNSQIAAATQAWPARAGDRSAVTARIGMFPPFGLLEQGAETAAAFLAQAAKAGIDHVCCGDHVSFAGTGFDGLVQATALAMLHPALPVYSGVYLLPLRHPVLVARQLADLAQLAPGRLILGTGIGGEDRHEVAICGVDPATRGKRMDECLAIVRQLLTGRPVTYHGTFFSFDEAVIGPAPAEPVPVIVGGRSDAAIRRAGRLGDGWLGIWNSPRRFAVAVEMAAEEAARAARPDPPSRHAMQVWCGIADSRPAARACLAPAMEAFYGLPFERFERYCPSGTPEDVAEFLAPYAEAGCTEFNLNPAVTRPRPGHRRRGSGERTPGTGMTESLVIPSRFRGPQGSGNGGYVCGRIAAHLDGHVSGRGRRRAWPAAAEVTLRRPPPLDTPMTVERHGGSSVRVSHGRTLIAEATSSPGSVALEIPAPVSLAEARAVAGRSSYYSDPMFPDCFACGMNRRPGDGLRIFPGPLPSRPLWAAPWTPDPSVAGSDGRVRPEVVWAALDCPSGIAAGEAACLPGDTVILLGQMTASLAALPAAGDQCRVIAWPGGRQGRKLAAGPALLSPRGQVLAAAVAVWLTVPRPVPALAAEGAPFAG